jgi:hypothetical protein
MVRKVGKELMSAARLLFVSMAVMALAAVRPASAAPANDHFAEAVVLEGSSGTTTGTNAGATREPGEPMIDGYDGEASVWWRWTAPATESVIFQTHGSDFDTILGVYTGNAVNALTLVAENDDPQDAVGLYSVVVFSAVAGTTYHLAVDGVDGEAGDIALSWLSGGPPNDDFADALVLEEAGSTTGLNLGATREPGEPSVDFNDGGRSVWWRWTAPRTERMVVFTFGSDFDTLLGVYTGAAVNALTSIAENDDGSDASVASLVSFEATAGTLYHFLVDGYDGESGNIMLTWIPDTGGTAGNDSFAGRIRLEGPEGRVAGNTSAATREAGEPDHVQSGGTRSIWWSWLAPENGTAEFNTFGSAFDTVLAVYTGALVNQLTLVAENDDDEISGDVASAISFRAAAGTEYQIAVDGYEGESGIVSLSWSFTPGLENPRFIRGDCDGDGLANLTDAVCTLEWLFRAGAEPECIAATNSDGIGRVNITDAVYLLLHLFRSGPPPAAPFPECGVGTLESGGEIGCWIPPLNCR